MPDHSQIDPATVAAYRRAEYRISEQLSLRVDQYNGELASWQVRHGVNSSAFITAVNPRSQRLSPDQNRARHERLRSRLAAEGLSFVDGAGLDPERCWPEEPGFLVAGIDQARARRLGQEFDQNAVVWSGPTATPQLLLLR